MAETRALEQSEFMAIEKPVSRISWGGIFIGAIATIALGLLLFALGAAIGLTAINPLAGEWGGNAGLWTGIWSFISIVLATFFGAWLAARASTVFFKRDAMSLGFMTWALSFVAMLFFVVTMATQTTTDLASAAGQAAPGAAAQVAPEQQNQLQQQLQQLQPGQIAGAAADAGAAAGWWFFISALASMLAGVFGAVAGMPKTLRHEKKMEVRRAQVRPQERHA